MIRLDTLADGIALRLLARNGIAAIWELQVAAGIAYRTGNSEAAACIMEIADAAEREWLQSESPASFVPRASTG